MCHFRTSTRLAKAVPKDRLASDFEHGIGAIQADDFCTRVTPRKPNCDIGEATPNIYDVPAVKGGKLLRKESDELRIRL